MTADVRVDVVHRFDETTPSVKNLLQSLDNANEEWEIYSHSLRPAFKRKNKYVGGVFENVSTAQAVRLATQIKSDNDILVIHKLLHKDIFHRLLDKHLPEKIFLTFDNVVYSTYDAEFLRQPGKSELLFEKADLVYATSKYIQAEAEKYTPADSIAYLPPSVDTEFFRPGYDVPEKYDSDTLTLGWIGNANVHEDNLQLLLRRLRPVAEEIEFELRLLLGGSTLPDSIISGLDDLDADVQTTEYLPWEEVPVFINGLDIGLAPLTDDKFNRGRSSEKVREYMSCGIPTVASDVGENGQLLDADSGIVADGSDEWLAAIDHLSDPETRQRYGKHARKRCEDTFSTDVIGQKVEQAFNAILSS